MSGKILKLKYQKKKQKKSLAFFFLGYIKKIKLNKENVQRSNLKKKNRIIKSTKQKLFS